MQAVYPEYQWDIYLFNKLPTGYKNLLAENFSYQEKFVKYLEKQLYIKKTSDWYRVTSKQMRKIVSMNMSDIMFIVRKFYPELNLRNFEENSPLSSKKSQYTLKSMLQILFSNYEIVEEYRHTDLENLELDYYIPELKLAFEYQVTYRALL